MRSLPVSLTKTELTAGWFWWVFQLLFLPILLTEGNRYLGAPLSVAQLNFTFFCVNFSGTLLILGRYVLLSCRHGLRKPFYTLQSAFLGFALYWLVTILLGFAIKHIFPDYVNQNDTSILQMLQEHPALITLGVTVLAPAAEELLFRGVIFGGLHNRSRVLAYAVSAVLFSLVHILGIYQEPVAFIVSFVNYLPAGLCLAWAYERSGSILAPLLMHIAINQIGMQVMR